MALTLRQLSSEGDLTKGSPLSASEIDGNFIFLKTLSTVTVLDDITSLFDGKTTAFPLTYNGSAVTVNDAHGVMVSLGSMMLEPGLDYIYESYVFPQEFETSTKGSYSIVGNTINFVKAPTAAQKFYGRLLGAFVNAPKPSNVFRAIPVVLS